MGCNRDIWKEFKGLDKGEYFVFIEIDWIDSTNITDFCVCAYGSS
jgi:hypothetical protein